jgi:hypothetical protein
MNIKKLALGAMAAIGMTAAPTQASAQFDRGTIETVAAVLLAQKFNIDPQILTALLGGRGGGLGGGSLYELAPLMAIQREAPNQSLSALLGLRNQGLGWEAIADRVGISDSEYSQMRSRGELDNNRVWRDTVLNELNLSNETVSRLRNMGFSWRDIVMTTVVSRESGRSLSEVAERFRRDRSWSRVASHFGVDRGDLRDDIDGWRRNRTAPRDWTTNSTTWAPPGLANRRFTPPGLAKKGGMPPGQAKKRGGDWRDDDDRRDDRRDRDRDWDSNRAERRERRNGGSDQTWRRMRLEKQSGRRSGGSSHGNSLSGHKGGSHKGSWHKGNSHKGGGKHHGGGGHKGHGGGKGGGQGKG